MKKLLLTTVLLLSIVNITSCKKENDDKTTTKITATALFNGDPVSGASLHLFKENPTQFIETKKSNSNGKTVFEVEPGDYSFEYEYYEGTTHYGGGTHTFTVTEGENKQITVNLEDY